MKQFLLVVLLFLALSQVVAGQGIEFSVQALPDIPGVQIGSSVRVLADGTVLVDALTSQRSIFQLEPAATSWTKLPTVPRGGVGRKQLIDGTVVVGSSYTVKNTLYYDAIPQSTPVGAYLQKIKNGTISPVCTDAKSYTVTNGDPLTYYRGLFPTPGDVIYFTGVRKGVNPTSGIYSSQEKTCQFTELIKSDPKYDLIQVIREDSDTFLVERALATATSIETEVVQLSPTGVVVLFSSNAANKPRVLTAPGCCNVILDPATSNGLVQYKLIDGTYHTAFIHGETFKEVQLPITTVTGLEPISLKGDYALLLATQKTVNDSLFLANTATGQGVVIYGPGVAFGNVTPEALNVYKADLDPKGNVIVLTNSPARAYKAIIKEAVTPPPPPVPTFSADSITNAAGVKRGIAPLTIQTIYGSHFLGIADKNALIVNDKLDIPTTLGGTQVLVNGKPQRITCIGDGQINFIMPDVEGTTAMIEVTAKDPTTPNSTVLRSNKVEVVVQKSLPDFFRSGGLVIVQDAITGEIATADKPLKRHADGKRYGILYATGLGTLAEVSPDGLQWLPKNTVSRTVLTAHGISINSAILFIGGAPGFPGLYQVNFVLDDSSVEDGKILVNMFFDGNPNPVLDKPFEIFVSE